VCRRTAPVPHPRSGWPCRPDIDHAHSLGGGRACGSSVPGTASGRTSDGLPWLRSCPTGHQVSALVASWREAVRHPVRTAADTAGHVCRIPTVRTALVLEAADGQSADRSVQVTSTVTVLQAWPWPTWSFWPATWMPPWLETRRCTRTGPWRRPMDWSLVGVKRSVVRPDAKVIADGAAAAPGRT
jgi:hypothetical protein